MSDKQCSATVFGPRVHSWQCQRNGVIVRDGKWFCRQHDPIAVKSRSDARDNQLKTKRNSDDAIYKEGHRIARLLKTLGVKSNVFYAHSLRFIDCGPREQLVISFQDCLKLVDLVRDAKRAVTPSASAAQKS